ncbi:MAG: heparinase II/III family protein [Pseudochelatococcus sp.]
MPVNPSLAKLRLYWETVRHLRAVQIYSRLLFRLSRPVPDTRPPPPLRSLAERWAHPAARRQSLFGEDAFRFLNETHELSRCGWDDASISKLWLYNLHYFDDLNASGAGGRTALHRTLIARWIAENPPGRGTGWEPYPVSLRIVNWIKWALAGNALPPDAVHSLAVQARWLTRRLEYHLLGNHLFANAKALVFAGCFFQGDEAEAWRKRGLDIIERELPVQVLPDGGHFELSTMYHALALEDMLDLINVARCFGNGLVDRAAERAARVAAMREWLAAMCHPDGEIAFFNDAAIGIAPTPAELEGYATRLGFPERSAGENRLRRLRDSGYIRIDDGCAAAMLDVAPIGPDYLPGHAHADTLSFELSVGGHRVLVNSGTSVYGTGAERLRQRGTAAHNTVVVDGQDSSEVWSGFRVARRAHPLDLVVLDNDGVSVTCAHDGYERLPGAPRHRRNWLMRDGTLTVADEISGPPGQAAACFHFHPDVTPSIGADGRAGAVSRGADGVLLWHVDKGQARLEASTWHPEFGMSIPTHCLVVDLAEGESRIAFSWNGASLNNASWNDVFLGR